MDNNTSFNIDNDNDINTVRRASSDKPSTLNLHSEEPPQRKRKKDTSKILMVVIICVLGLVLIGGAIYFINSNKEREEEMARIQAEKEAAEVAYQEDLAKQDMDNLENEFSGIESPRQMVITDSVKMRLAEKYDAAKLEIENLQRQLKDTKNKSAKELQDLRNQIASLRALLKHYIEEINRLNAENEALRTENAEIKDANQRLTSQVEQTSRENANLTERMTLAEKLNVTGVSLQALNAKGKNEKKVQKAKKLAVTFTIPQNNSTPVGEKTIWLRITTPEGQLLDGGGSFSFEGSSLAASAHKTIEYGGQEIGGITIYYDVRQALNPGAYTVELFCDNFRLKSASFTLK